MPTARELLDQADALMRRNRKRGKDRLGDVPTLSDALDGGRDSALAPTLILPPAGTAIDPIVFDAPKEGDPGSSGPADDVDPMPLDTLADVPVLTDVVLDWPPADVAVGHLAAQALREPAIVATSPVAGAVFPEMPGSAGSAGSWAADALTQPGTPRDAGDAFPASAAEAEAAASALPPPAVLEREADDVSGPATPQVADAVEATHRDGADGAMPPRVPFLDDDFILEIPPMDQGAAPPVHAAPTPASIAATTLASGSREWDALAEEIRMQVLQRLDLFTDTGLREQLGARLAPIVERASAQLIETINRELGELVRGYVAEAIEREIDSWRNQNPAKAE